MYEITVTDTREFLLNFMFKFFLKYRKTFDCCNKNEIQICAKRANSQQQYKKVRTLDVSIIVSLLRTGKIYLVQGNSIYTEIEFLLLLQINMNYV